MPVITTVLSEGLLAARPAASASNAGFLYFASDQNGGTLYQSDGASWVQIAAAVTQSAASVGAVANAGGAPSLQVGLDASLPAAGTAGRLYVARDTGNVYEDTGSAWLVVATAQWANLTGKPSTFTPGAHESTHLAAGGDAIAREGLLPQVASSVESLATDPATPADGRTWLNTAVGAIKARIAGATEILNDWTFLRNKPSTFTPATHTHPESDVTSLAADLAARVQLSPGSQQGGAINVSGEVQGSDFKPGGVTGATAAARYHAATATGHPTTGTWQVGDIVPDQTGTFWFCTVAGTPGTWVQVGGTGGGAGSSTLAGDTDVAISSPVGGQVLGYSSALSKWVNQNQAGVAATTQTAQLGANVTMATPNTWYDGPSVTLPPGTWFLIGRVLAAQSGNPGKFEAVLWDGTTTYATAQSALNPSTNLYNEVPLAAVVQPTTTMTYKISGRSDAASNSMFAASDLTSMGNNATTLTAIQLSGNPVGQQAPAVHAYNTGSLTVPNNVETAIPLDSTRFDQGTTTPQHSTSSNTSRLTCQQAGIYTITGQIAWNGTFANSEVRIRLNGSTDIASQRIGSGTGMSVNVVYQLAVGDYVEMTAFQNSGGNGTIFGSTTIPNYGTEFMMARIDSGSSTVLQVTTQTADYTIPSVQTLTIVGAAGKTMTLPTAINAGGQSCIVKNNGSATSTTVATTASQTIDGASTHSLVAANESATFVSDGSNWYVV